MAISNFLFEIAIIVLSFNLLLPFKYENYEQDEYRGQNKGYSREDLLPADIQTPELIAVGLDTVDDTRTDKGSQKSADAAERRSYGGCLNEIFVFHIAEDGV